MAEAVTQPVRIVFCTRGGILGALVLRDLLGLPGVQVTGIVRSTRVFRATSPFWGGAWEFFRRTGIPYTIYLWLCTSVAEQSWLLGGRHSCRHLAKKHHIPFFETKNINSPRALDFLTSCSPEMLLCAFFDQILYPPLCDAQRFTVWNLHPAPLPEYRGVDPIFHALLNEESQLGITLHRISEVVDEGEILGQKSICIQTPYLSVMGYAKQLMKIGVQLFAEQIAPDRRHMAGTPQKMGGSYKSWPYAREVRKFYCTGKHLLTFRDYFTEI